MAKDADILKEAQDAFEKSAEHEGHNRDAWEDDIDFALLENQWPEAIRKQREQDNRPTLTASLLAPMIRQVVNEARQNKPGITVHPADSDADPETAEIFNGLIRNIEQSSNAEVAYDTALEHAVAGGFGYFRINTAYSSDDTFDQDIIVDRIANPLSVYGDPASTAVDSSDWNVAFVTDTLTKDQFEKQYKGADAVNWSDDYGSLTAPWLDGDNVMIAEYWTREEVKRQIVLLSDQTVMGLDEYKTQKALFDSLGVTVVGQPRDVRSHKVTQRIMSGAEVLETVEWAGRYIPIIPVYGSEVNLKGKRYFRSMIRSAKDAQRMRNYWRTQTTEMVALQTKAPWIGKKGAFETDQQKWATANTQNWSYIEYDGQDAPQRQPFAGVPAGAMQEALTAGDDIKAIVGIYDSSLGARSNETSGVAINARDRQADTGTFHFIDNLSRAIRHAGRVMIDLIPEVYSVPRVLRVIGKDGSPQMAQVNQPFQQPQTDENGKPVVDPATGQAQTIEKIYDLSAGKYDLIVKAGPSFASQREEFFQMATELIRAYPDAAPVLGDLMIKNYDIPDAEEVGKRLAALNPANKGQIPPEVQQGIQQLQQHAQQTGQALQQTQAQLQELANENAQLKAKNDLEARKLDIAAFDAETKRMTAMQPSQVRIPE
jgi:hypothetical protein